MKAQISKEWIVQESRHPFKPTVKIWYLYHPDLYGAHGTYLTRDAAEQEIERRNNQTVIRAEKGEQ